MPDRQEPPEAPGEPAAPQRRPAAPPPRQPDSVWARPDPDAAREPAQPGWSAPEGWGHQPSPGPPPGVEAGPGPAAQPGWGTAGGWEQGPPGGSGPPGGREPRGWEPAAPRRGPGRTRLVVGAGIALLLVIAVVALLSLRGFGGQPTASPSTVAPFAPGTGGGTGGGTPTPGGGGVLGTGSLRLPDQVGGLARIPLDDPSLAQGQQGLLDLITRSGAIDGWTLGAYGPDRDDPRFVFMVVRSRQAETAGVIAGELLDGVRANLGGDLSVSRTVTRNGVRYDCLGGSVGSICSFQDGATVGIGFGRDSDLDRLSQLTDEARRGVRG